MVVISFCVFRDKILDGTKDQTIRPYSQKRYDALSLAYVFHLWWRQRTEERIKIGEAKRSENIKLLVFSGDAEGGYCPSWLARPGSTTGTPLTSSETDELVRRDGFASLSDMIALFREMHGEQFSQTIFMVVRWRMCECQ